MKKILLMGFVIALVFGAMPVLASEEVTKNYGDVTLSGGFESGNFPQVWDLTQCDLVLNFTYDATGLVDDLGAHDAVGHAWAELGVRQVGYNNFNPTWNVEGAGVWLATDYDWTANTFDPDPDGSPTLDLDDKLILQKAGSIGEGDYNLPPVSGKPKANYGIWFDRDGVDESQAEMWGAIDGGTYNTGGTYDVVIILHATSLSGTAYMTINGVQQGFYDPGHCGQPDLYPAGMTFTGDMTQMQVFYGLCGYGATHSVVFKDIIVTGCLYRLYWTEVNIDIKPGSDANSINLKSKGVVSVAVLTTDDFDASTVNPGTVVFAGAEPAGWTMEDVDGDDDLDMLFNFKTQELVDLTKDSREATLTGETSNPINPDIKGTDTVNIVHEKKQARKGR